MIKKLHIGETVTLQQHPFSISTELKIGGNASYTSPILNVADVLIAKGFDTATNDLVPQKKSSQALCYFYSNKLGTFEKHWIPFAELNNIIDPNPKYFEQKIINGKLASDFKENDEIIGITKKELSIDELKDRFIYKTVVLKSADLELQKQKLHFQQFLEDKNKFSIENYHEFLSPMMTVIDVVDNKNFNNDRLDEKAGTIKRLPSKYFLKCRWFNPIKQTFSEELLPPFIVQSITQPLKISELITAQENKKVQILNNGNESKIVEIKKVVQVHHTFRVVYQDILLQKHFSDNLNEIGIDGTDFVFKDLLGSNLSVENMKQNHYYHITYIDKANRKTSRIITNPIISHNDEGEVFVNAKCLLRNKEVRNFRIDGIQNAIEMNKNFDALMNKTN